MIIIKKKRKQLKRLQYIMIEKLNKMKKKTKSVRDSNHSLYKNTPLVIVVLTI